MTTPKKIPNPKKSTSDKIYPSHTPEAKAKYMRGWREREKIKRAHRQERTEEIVGGVTGIVAAAMNASSDQQKVILAELKDISDSILVIAQSLAQNISVKEVAPMTEEEIDRIIGGSEIAPETTGKPIF